MPESVSVIIPTWNRAHTIEAAVNSVLAQTHPVYEILVCDDGSTDHTKEIVNAMIDPRVKLVEGQRAGRPAIPRNRGIQHAEGEWIAFLDSDDTWLPQKLERQFQLIKADGTSAGCTDAWRITPGQGRTVPYLGLETQRIRLRKLLDTNYVICSSMMVEKKILNDVGGFPEDENLKAIEDYALWLRVASQTNISFCGEPLVEYLDDAPNSIRSGIKESEQRENVMLDFHHWYSARGPLAERNAVRNALRKAMKNNGRSFIERWKVK